MRWLPAIPLVALPLWAAWAPGCSSDDNSQPALGDASQPPVTKFEAGSNCSTSDDCETGLVCLYPATVCSALPVCVAPPAPEGGACEAPQLACSCLGEVIQVCNGYATNPVDSTSTCEGGTVIVPTEAGTDAVAPPADAGSDGAADATVNAAPVGVDASDASSE